MACAIRVWRLPRSEKISATWVCRKRFDSASVWKPSPCRSLLFYSGLAVIADALWKNGRQPGFLGVGKRHPVIAEVDRLQLAFENIVGGWSASHRPWPREGRIHLIALPATKRLRFDEAFPGGRPARVQQIRGLGAQNPGHNGIARSVL